MFFTFTEVDYLWHHWLQLYFFVAPCARSNTACLFACVTLIIIRAANLTRRIPFSHISVCNTAAIGRYHFRTKFQNYLHNQFGRFSCKDGVSERAVCEQLPRFINGPFSRISRCNRRTFRCYCVICEEYSANGPRSAFHGLAHNGVIN